MILRGVFLISLSILTSFPAQSENRYCELAKGKLNELSTYFGFTLSSYQRLTWAYRDVLDLEVAAYSQVLNRLEAGVKLSPASGPLEGKDDEWIKTALQVMTTELTQIKINAKKVVRAYERLVKLGNSIKVPQITLNPFRSKDDQVSDLIRLCSLGKNGEKTEGTRAVIALYNFTLQMRDKAPIDVIRFAKEMGNFSQSYRNIRNQIENGDIDAAKISLVNTMDLQKASAEVESSVLAHLKSASDQYVRTLGDVLQTMN